MCPSERAGIREEDPDLRRKLEERVTAAARTSAQGGPSHSGGHLTLFLQQNIIRAILEGGLETTVVSNGVRSWEYKPPGGYRVVLSYHITTPDASFDAQVAVESTEGAGRGEG